MALCSEHDLPLLPMMTEAKKSLGRAMRYVILAGALAAPINVFAQGEATMPLVKPDATQPCYELVPMPTKEQPYGPLLLNRCTGATWLLVRSGLPDVAGKATNSFVFRWAPLGASSGESVLSFGPGPSPSISLTGTPRALAAAGLEA